MFTTVILFAFFLFVNQIDGRTFHRREDSLVVMRDQCAKNPYADECTRVKTQMEDLLRKCNEMATPVQACNDVKQKYCFIWPRELYCIGYSGGGQTTKSPWNYDSDWSQIPTDSNELKRRGDYCVTHQSEQKCRNLLNSLKIRYDECSTRPKTDYSCQTFKVSLCAAFPKFSPCLNGGGLKRRITQLEHALNARQ